MSGKLEKRLKEETGVVRCYEPSEPSEAVLLEGESAVSGSTCWSGLYSIVLSARIQYRSDG